ncbi:hypothetical protein ACRAWG_35615 [Methylobacterium sp. P31]
MTPLRTRSFSPRAVVPVVELLVLMVSATVSWYLVPLSKTQGADRGLDRRAAAVLAQDEKTITAAV